MTVLLFAPLYPPQSGGAARYFEQVERVAPGNTLVLTTPHDGRGERGVRRQYPRAPTRVPRGVADLLRVLRARDVELAHVHPHFPHYRVYKRILEWFDVPVVYDVRDYLYDPALVTDGDAYLVATEDIGLHLLQNQSIPADLEVSPVVVGEAPDYRFRFPPAEDIVAYVGDLTEAKGAHVAMQACDYLDVSLHVAGTGPLRNGVESYHYHGELTHSDAMALIAGADALVLPSESEGLPRVVLEARGVGTPVVATPVGGIPDVVGVDDQLVDRTPEDVARGIRRALDEERSVGSASPTGNIEAVRQAVEAAYRSVLGKQP